MSVTRPPAAINEMLRSFTTLAVTLNLSQTAESLGITRHTVTRHLKALEALKGGKLLVLRRRRYVLTDLGASLLEGALRVVKDTDDWLQGANVLTKADNGLSHIAVKSDDQFNSMSQQHPLNRLWVDSPPLLARGFEQWVAAKTKLETPEMALLRPYLVLYRRFQNSWLCIETGEKSSYASWFGWNWAKSSMGCAVQDMPSGASFSNLLLEAFLDIYESCGARLDHVHTCFPREKDGPQEPVNFQRLLLGCTLPDNSLVLAVLVARTYQIDITGVSDQQIKLMPADLQMEFDPLLI
ncbi:LysR family transcriptional regulator [Rhodovibrionaceae bacterium A322]